MAKSRYSGRQAMEVPVKTLPGIFLLALLVPLEAQQAQAPVGIMQDGGVSQVLQSIYIPPLLNAPFTAIVHTQWIRTLPEGGTFTLVNQRRIARDSHGRIYEERWLLVPKDGKTQSQMNVIQAADPNAHTLYNCFLLQQPHRCTLETFAETATEVYKPATRPTGLLPHNAGFSAHTDLGVQSIEGIDTTGMRESITYNEGVYGNDRPFSVTREFWFAASLGINLLSEITNPSFGKQVFTVTDINLSEPDAKLFEPPEGFEVVDHRKTASPQQ
jgi:hypothetical protein